MRLDMTANGQYDYTQPWYNNANDRVSYERAFQQPDRAKQLEAQALMCALPTTPNEFIREQMTAPMYTPQFGAMAQTSPTLDDVLAGQFSNAGNLVDRAPTDFSGSTAGQESSSIPSLPPR
jgi:hypothetical protein